MFQICSNMFQSTQISSKSGTGLNSYQKSLTKYGASFNKYVTGFNSSGSDLELYRRSLDIGNKFKTQPIRILII